MQRLSCIVLSGLAAGACALAQTTFATLTGTVTDPNGAVIPGANIEAIHQGSNYRYTARSSDAGIYTLGQLREGVYMVRAHSPGFNETVIAALRLASLEIRRLELRLEIGTVETRVEVPANAGAIETETARISDSKGAAILKSLPLNTRSLSGFLGLTPGVVQAGAGSSTRRFAGSRANQEDTTIDGITVANGFDGTQIGPLYSYIESYEEIRIDMANNTAEFGAIGQVTVVSKSGANELHGVGLDYYGTPWFRARDPFAPARSGNVSHSLGGLISGPLVLPHLYNGRNRSFFSFSLETSRGSQIRQNLNPTVPLVAWRQGDFSRLATMVRDPFGGNTPFPGNRIPAARINPVSQRIQERFWPLPNTGDPNLFVSQNHRVQLPRAFDPNTYVTGRGDHRFSDKFSMFGRFTWDRQYSRQYTGGLPTIGQNWQTRSTRGFMVSATHSIRANLLNEFRYGFAYNNNPRNPPTLGRQVAQELGIQGLVDNLPDINGLFKVNFTGLGITAIGVDQDWRHPGFENWVQQFQEHLSWYRGRHNLKAGALLIRVVFNDRQANTALFGSVNFSNRYSGYPYGDFLLGLPNTAARAFPPELIQRLRWGGDFFVADDFKVTPKLTLNLGARYEYHPGWVERSGRQAVFDIGASKIVVPDGSLNLVSPLMPRGYVDIIEASQAGYDSRKLLTTDRGNIAPRIGLAYRPWGNDTVIRTGYGIFYDLVARSVTAGGAPFVLNEPTFTNPAVPVVVFPRVFPQTAGGLTTVGLPGAYRKDLRTPQSMQYNFTVEHQRWDTGFRLSYIGTNTRQGEWGYNINQPVPDNQLYVDKTRRFPTYPNITYISNGAGHQYNSLTAEVERRFARGLAYQFSYVLARDIGDLERGESPENAYDRKRERAVWLDIPTHRMTSNFVWQLPFGNNRRFLNQRGVMNVVAGGWEISGVYSIHSGQFLTPLWTGPDPTGTAFTASRTPAQVTIRADHLRDANLPPAQRAVNRWFDNTAFGAPRPGNYGTAAKGVIKGPGSNIFNVGLMKNFPVGERLNLRFELTATNTFNHPNWANPNTNITAVGQVGVISAVGGVANLDQSGPRNLRSGLRVEW